VELLSHLVALKPMCIQLSHSGVIEFTGGDTATARFTERQRGKGSDDCYENLAVHHDEFVRLDDPGSSGAAITTATLMRPPSRASLFSPSPSSFHLPMAAPATPQLSPAFSP
jgi:hypothetical protein